MKGGQHFYSGMRNAEGFALLRPEEPRRVAAAVCRQAAAMAYLGCGQFFTSRSWKPSSASTKFGLREESNVTYWREPEKATELVQTGKSQLAFFLNPTQVEEVRAYC